MLQWSGMYNSSDDNTAYGLKGLLQFSIDFNRNKKYKVKIYGAVSSIPFKITKEEFDTLQLAKEACSKFYMNLLKQEIDLLNKES